MQINRTQKPTLPQIVTVCKDLQTKQPKPSIDFPQNMRPNGVKFLFRILKQNQQGNWEKWDGITPSNISETYTGNCSDSNLCIWIAQKSWMFPQFMERFIADALDNIFTIAADVLALFTVQNNSLSHVEVKQVIWGHAQ